MISASSAAFLSCFFSRRRPKINHFATVVLFLRGALLRTLTLAFGAIIYCKTKRKLCGGRFWIVNFKIHVYIYYILRIFNPNQGAMGKERRKHLFQDLHPFLCVFVPFYFGATQKVVLPLPPSLQQCGMWMESQRLHPRRFSRGTIPSRRSPP